MVFDWCFIPNRVFAQFGHPKRRAKIRALDLGKVGRQVKGCVSIGERIGVSSMQVMEGKGSQARENGVIQRTAFRPVSNLIAKLGQLAFTG